MEALIAKRICLHCVKQGRNHARIFQRQVSSVSCVSRCMKLVGGVITCLFMCISGFGSLAQGLDIIYIWLLINFLNIPFFFFVLVYWYGADF